MASPLDDFIDPIEAHLKRETCEGAGVSVIVLARDGRERALQVFESIASVLRGRNRKAFPVFVDVDETTNHAEVLEDALRIADQPLTLVVQGRESLTAAHLAPLLKTIDHCDHAIGGRATSRAGKVGRWIRALPWRWVFAVPIHDLHSPCRLHRTEKLAAIPFQSRSEFLNIEILAKATFLGQLLDEAEIPAIEGRKAWISWSDVSKVFKHPTFRAHSIPAEDSQGQDESHDRPDGQDGHGGDDLKEGRAVEDHGAERVE